MSLTIIRNVRRRKFIKRLKKISFGVLGLGLLLLILIPVLRYVLRPDTIIIAGVENLKSEELQSFVLSSFTDTSPLFVTNKLVDALKLSFPRIAEVDLRRNIFKRTLEIGIIERKSWAVWCSDGESACFYIDETGTLFREAPAFSGGLVLKISDNRGIPRQLGDQFLDTQFLKTLQDFIIELEHTRQSHVTNITITRDLAFWITLSEGWKVVLDTETDITQALGNLDIFLTSAIKDSISNLDYIDLRFSSKGFYKLRR